MKVSSRFEKWIPLDNINQIYDVDNVRYDKDGITFILIPDGQAADKYSPQLLLTWEEVLSYKVSKEEYCPEYWSSSPRDTWSFYFSKTSSYLHEFKSKSELFPDNAIHFLLIGTNLIEDILSTEFPKISFN